jgi:multisubunit Na+/H+ antiporter MnhE subunit
MMLTLKQTLAAVRLVAHFAAALVTSGLQTLWVILRTSAAEPPPTRLVRMGFAPMTPAGAVLLGCLITLTPGTTTLDIDLQRQELLLHVLDASDPEAVVAGIQQDFERHLVTLFGLHASR